jgi:hypothetical protein
MTTSLDITNFRRIVAALKKTPEVAMPILKHAMNDSLRILQGSLKEYPPASEANRPGRMRLGDHPEPVGYYEQGRGWWEPHMRPLTGPWGISHGQQTADQAGERFKVKIPGQVAAYKLEPSSEQLGRSWTIEIVTGKDVVVGRVGTNTSYADHVQGSRQPFLFRRRGWDTADMVLFKHRITFVSIFDEAAKEIIKEVVFS